MIQEIKIFLFVLSITYLIRIIVEFTLKLIQENPEPIKLSKIEQTIQLIALSYIITYILI